MLILIAIHSPFAVWNVPGEHVSRLRREFPAHTFLHATDDAQALALMPEADVAFSSQIGREHLQAARRLKWIHSPAAGVGGMLFPEMIESGVTITNSRGMSADTMAEHVLATCRTAEASWYEGVGHAPHIEDPERFNRELATLTRRVRA